MFAKRVEAIMLDTVLGIGKDRAHILCEDVVAQTLDLLDFVCRARQADHQHLGAGPVHGSAALRLGLMRASSSIARSS